MIYVNLKQLFIERLVYYSSVLGGRDYVSMVLRYYLSASASYILGHVVDRRGDRPVESFVVHSLFMRLVEYDYEDCLALFLIFFINLLDAIDINWLRYI